MENNNQTNNQSRQESAPAVDFSAIERAAAAANDLNSFSTYKPGTATATISAAIEEARENLNFGLSRCATEKQKDDLKAKFSSYEKKIVLYYFDYYKNEAACPSVLICGAGNFPTAKKERQNARRDSLHQEWQQLESLKDSLKGGYNMAISSDDPQAVEALTAKLEKLKKAHAFKVSANAYFRKNKTFKGMDGLTDEAAEKLDSDARNAAARMGGRCEPFPAWSLSNENAEIKRIEKRLQELQEAKETTLSGWNFNGGRVEIDAENMRIGVYFDERTTGADLEALQKENKDLILPRLLWSPRFQRWQCQYNAVNVRRLRDSKTYAPSDEESKKAVEEEQQRRQEAQKAEEEKAKAEKAKKAEARKDKINALQEKQNELKKTGFILKPSMLAYCNNNLSEYMKAGHGIRRIINVSDTQLLTVEISYNHQWSDVKKPKYIEVTINEAARTKDAIITGSEYMNVSIKIRDVPEAEKRQLATLKSYAEQYKPETDDARILALYEAWKRSEIATVKTWGHLEGTTLHEESAREFLTNWKPGGESPKQEEPQEEQPQEEPATEPTPAEEQKQEQPTPPQYLSIQGEQLYLF